MPTQVAADPRLRRGSSGVAGGSAGGGEGGGAMGVGVAMEEIVTDAGTAR
ncbi:MAG: hypothetical protein QOE28_2415 [Solirubrobacteraceae bacterium]|nr:hypothetical protein [Solirubrobacteraceae bacterium]